jgi:hypothetical protein
MKRHVLGILIIGLALVVSACGRPEPTSEAPDCTVVPLKEDAAQEGVADGAVIVYERLGGANCVDEVWNIYPDGRIVGENGSTTLNEQVTADEITQLLADIDAEGFFDLESTEHVPCGDCFTYHITVDNGGEVKTVSTVDGGTDTPGAYWRVFAEISHLLPDFPEA